MIDNYNTVYENLPNKIKGFVLYNSAEDFYTIVLNSRASHEANKITLEHELSHIANNDFHKCQTVTLLEAIRHKRG